MQHMHKTWAQKGWAAAGGRRPPFWGAAEGRPPSFVHLLHCFYMSFACVAFMLHFIKILFASLLGMMRQLLRQWLLPRMLWMLLLLYRKETRRETRQHRKETRRETRQYRKETRRETRQCNEGRMTYSGGRGEALRLQYIYIYIYIYIYCITRNAFL